MLKIRDIETYFDALYPKSLSSPWDNDGLLVCPDRDRPAETVVTCLDVTFSVIEKAFEVGAELIVSHHPLIFTPVAAINEDSLVGQKISLLFQRRVSLLSLHTRFDAAENGLNASLAKLLGIRLEKGVSILEEDPYVGGIGMLDARKTPEDFAASVSAVLGGPVRLYSAGIGIEKVGICAGGGKDLILPSLKLGVDAFVTGDVNYHTAQTAQESGMSVLDCGHHQTEAICAGLFQTALTSLDPKLRVFPVYEDLGGEVFRG